MDAPANLDLRLSLGYVPAGRRDAMAALFALDARLGGIVARTREPAIGLMRLVWWQDALDGLNGAPPPAEPLLVALSGAGLPGPALAAMTAGWEALLDDPDLGNGAVACHAEARGSRLFALAGNLLDAAPEDAPRLVLAGSGWALADLARRLDRPRRTAEIRAQARSELAKAFAMRWPRRLRPLGQLAALALGDVDVPLSPRRRVLRAFRHQLTGR